MTKQALCPSLSLEAGYDVSIKNKYIVLTHMNLICGKKVTSKIGWVRTRVD